MIDTAAFLDCLAPDSRANQVFSPKRPYSALARSNRVNHALLLAAAFSVRSPKDLQKYTIFGDRLFNNSCPQAHAFEIPLPQLLRRYFQEACNEINLQRSHPDITGTRPGAASATPQTLKMQTANIPRGSIFLSHSPRDSLRRDNFMLEEPLFAP